MDAEWIRQRLDAIPGKTQAGLARALGLDPAAVTRILQGKRHIKAYEIPAIEAYFDAPHRESPPLPRLLEPTWRGGETIPVLGVAEAGKDGLVEWNGEVVDRVAKPPFMAGATNAYAVFVQGDSMWPRYSHGELVYVHPGRPVTPGCFVVAQFETPDSPTPRAFIKQYVRRGGTQTVLHQFNPKKDIALATAQLKALHRIVGSGEA
jgi:phage repressor protein C with HTH and peptisase S24 domain